MNRSSTLPEGFFLRDTLSIARDLVGCRLLRIGPAGGSSAASGRIVETEAYLADDPASHSFRGPTRRNRSMFLPAGTVYVYRIYGMHQCVNIVTGPGGVGEAVLLRAMEPESGIREMYGRRFGGGNPAGPTEETVRRLCSGPGNLCRALDITIGNSDGRILSETGPLYIAAGPAVPGEEIVAGPRIGLSPGRGETLPYRFCLSGSAFLSRPAG